MSTISVNIKCSTEDKFSVSIETTKTVLELKEAIAKHLETTSIPTPPANQRLIYAGRVLKDEETVAIYKIADGNTLHLVRTGVKPATSAASTPAAPAASSPATTTPASQAPPATTPAAAAPAPTPDLSANPFAALGGLGALGGNPWAAGAGGAAPGLGGMGMGMPGMGPGFGGANPMSNMDPALMSQLMSNPAVANSISQMFSNPAFLDMMTASNPQLASMMTPEVRAMMQSEGFQRMMSNPDTVRAMMQMAPLMGGGMNPFGPAAMGGAYGAGAAAGAGAPAGAAAAPGANPMAPTGLGGFDPALLGLLMGGGLGGAGGLGAAPLSPPPANPEEAYQGQLRQLQDMGFYDAAENIRALTMTRGNVEAAVEWLLSNPPVRR
ncbi:hypothetical protein HDV05_006966 [Chytridiales sp. JEL 0842]|nr:hypothetical protein HDV05_006966 [Chytridiales sp. JEL 0842]